jgi:hypothetical protein
VKVGREKAMFNGCNPAFFIGRQIKVRKMVCLEDLDGLAQRIQASDGNRSSASDI